jgi:DNA-binding transcriptional regulator LsrR (DeoR family)
MIKNIFEENEKRAQKSRVYKALLIEPLTMLEISNYTNIRRANICRYISEMEEAGIVCIIAKRKCTISGHPFVGEYTADKSLFPYDNQLIMNF